jgi:catechol 2,3-dioxygenase-like lactoylglutathione lyase family enzyme
MAIEPFMKCRDVLMSLSFYTSVLDFVVVRPPDSVPNSFMSKYSLIEINGCQVHLSSHSGDGEFGNVVYVRVGDIDPLYRKFVTNGLNTDASGQYPSLRIPPVEQIWGMKKFPVTDPDGNKITFAHQIA